MKKYLIAVFTFIFIYCSTFAGDIPESLMSGKHKALFIGKLSVKEDVYTIIPSTVMMGEIAEKEIRLEKFDAYYGTPNKPKDGDIIVAVLIDDHQIDDTWVFKCTSEDYKKLKLVSERYNMVERYEKYINDGEYFRAQQRLDEATTTADEDNDIETEQVLNTNETAEHANEENESNPLTIVSCSLLFVLFIILLVIKYINNKRRGK